MNQDEARLQLFGDKFDAKLIELREEYRDRNSTIYYNLANRFMNDWTLILLDDSDEFDGHYCLVDTNRSSFKLVFVK